MGYWKDKLLPKIKKVFGSKRESKEAKKREVEGPGEVESSSKEVSLETETKVKKEEVEEEKMVVAPESKPVKPVEYV